MSIKYIYEEPQPITEKEVFEAIDNDNIDRLIEKRFESKKNSLG